MKIFLLVLSLLFINQQKTSSASSHLAETKSSTFFKKTSVDDLNFSSSHYNKYITRFKKVALLEMVKFGIPASVKIAQGILESTAGENYGAKEFNNHFGVKYKGKIKDIVIGFHTKTEGRFNTYVTAWACFRHHSLIMVSERYSHAVGIKSYAKYAAAIRRSGYAEDKAYVEKLINVIEANKLYKIDDLVFSDFDLYQEYCKSVKKYHQVTKWNKRFM